MPLPEIYRPETMREGKLNPDFGPLDAALDMHGPEPIIDDMHALGDKILAIGEALPRIGQSGVFGYIYGTLTHTLADRLDGASHVSHLPAIENPEDLERQGGHFANTWIEPVRHFRDQAKARLDGDLRAHALAARAIEPHWGMSFDDPDIQFGSNVVKFVADGMGNHILGDLHRSLIRSGVSEAYMRPGGDYDVVNKYIRYVTTMKATELMGGNETLVRMAVQPVPIAIAGMRRYARNARTRMLQAKTEREFEDIAAKGRVDAIRMNRIVAKNGLLAVRAMASVKGMNRFGAGSLPDAA